MDGSTAARFSLMEVAGGSLIQILQTAFFGISPRSYKRWQMLMLASILFHHSNIRLPRWLERPLARVIATPRLHGLHHSMKAEERATNFSSGLVIWDQLHGSYRYDEQPVRVGLPDVTTDVSHPTPGAADVEVSNVDENSRTAGAQSSVITS